MSTHANNPRSAYAKGVRSGITDIVAFGKYETAPVYVHKAVGSFKTDRDVRYSDVKAFGSDVRRGRRTVLGK